MIALDDATTLYPSLLIYAYDLTRDRSAAEDIVQEAYLRYCEKPPRGSGPAQVRSWLNKVIRNLVIDHFRRQNAIELTVFSDWDGASCLVCGSMDARCSCCG